MGVARIVFRTLWIFGLLLLCVPLHYAAGLAGPSAWPRRFLRWTARAAGIRVRMEGEPLTHDVLFASNHKSWLDILLLGGSAGAAFVSKEEVGRWPVVGWMARLNGTIFVARAERSNVQCQADALRSALATGRPVALFPEGTVSETGELLPFRPSLFAALYPPLPAVQAQPVAIDYGQAASDVAWREGETIVANALRILGRRGAMPVILRFLAPLDPDGAGGRKALAAAAEARVAAALGAFEAGRDAL